LKDFSQLWNNLFHNHLKKTILLFLDYDGTLAPIAPTPEEAILPRENKLLLERLVKIPSFQLVVISGRALSDVKHMVGVKGIVYSGNHGWEIEGVDIHFESLLSPEISALMESIKYELAARLSDIQGAFIEDKGVTLSVHYRQVPQDKELLVKRLSHQTWQNYERQNRIRISPGKKVLEVRPPVDWDKGKAALWILRKQEILRGKGQVLPIYIGDDVSDEEAFKALRAQGITILVSEEERSSAAEYRIKGPSQVTEILKHMVEMEYEKL
jgi:trehalose 6-phosphate phosphatase